MRFPAVNTADEIPIHKCLISELADLEYRIALERRSRVQEALHNKHEVTVFKLSKSWSGQVLSVYKKTFDLRTTGLDGEPFIMYNVPLSALTNIASKE